MDRWSRGQSAREIAEAIGCGLNRNKVIGKVHRLQAKQTKADIAERAVLRAERVKALAPPVAPKEKTPEREAELALAREVLRAAVVPPAPSEPSCKLVGDASAPAVSMTLDAGPKGKKAPATSPRAPKKPHVPILASLDGTPFPRVKLSAEGVRKLYCSWPESERLALRGVSFGLVRRDCLRVRWDHKRTSETCHSGFIEFVSDDLR